MQPLFEANPLLWALSSSFGIDTAFSDSAPHEPRAHISFSSERSETLFDRLFEELIKDQEWYANSSAAYSSKLKC